MVKSVQVAVRLDPETVELADEVAELIGEVSPIQPKRMTVLRAAIERGLRDMKAELTTSKGGKRRKR